MAKIVGRKKGEKKVKIKTVTNAPENLPVPKFDLEEVNRLIHNRRSVFPKDFSGEPVSREEIEQLIENAHWAPNHGKTEPWFFKIFTGAGLKRFADAQAEIYKEGSSPDKYKPEKYEKLRKKPLRCTHIIAICMKKGDNPKIPELEEIEAVSCAVQNLWLTATAMGLAGYWSSGGPTYFDGMRDFLGLGEEDKCLGFFYLGKPANGWPRGERLTSWRSKMEWVEK